MFHEAHWLYFKIFFFPFKSLDHADASGWNKIHRAPAQRVQLVEQNQSQGWESWL